MLEDNKTYTGTLTYDRRYFATGSAALSFIWSRNFWKSNCGGSPSFPFPEGVLLPPFSCSIDGVLVLGTSATARGLGVDCCFANDDSVAGDGTAAAESRDRGLCPLVRGKANVRARAAREGKEGTGDEERMGVEGG